MGDILNELGDELCGTPYEGGKRTSGSGESLLVELETPNAIKTLDDALAVAEVDQRQWRVKKWRVKTYQQGQKLKIDGNRLVAAVTLHSVSLDLERRAPEHIFDTFDWMAEKFKHCKIAKVRKVNLGDGERVMKVVGLKDIHLGAYAHSPEAGDDNDCDIVQEKTDYAIETSIQRARFWNVSKILIPIGSDLLHSDNWKDTTFNGTPLDVDTRGKRVFRIACQMMLHAINRLRSVAPVEFVYCPGNHDTTVSWYLTEWLAVMFRDCEDVTYIRNDEPFSFHRFGESLVGLNHGDKIPPQRLAGMMPVKARDLWAQTSYWEWLTGHVHKRKATHFAGVDTYDGIVVRVCPSLCSTDYWHNSKGFNTSRKALDCYFYGEESGLVGTSTVGLPRYKK